MLKRWWAGTVVPGSFDGRDAGGGYTLEVLLPGDGEAGMQ